MTPYYYVYKYGGNAPRARAAIAAVKGGRDE